MNCINKTLKFQQAEKRISLFSSVYLCDKPVKAPINSLDSTLQPQTYVRTTLDTPKSNTTHYKLKKGYSRKPQKERIYQLKPGEYKTPGEYQIAREERMRIENGIEFRKYHKEMIQTTFIGVDCRDEGEML